MGPVSAYSGWQSPNSSPGNPTMAENHHPARIVLTTAANPDEATLIAGTLVEERLAACATLVPGVQSIYHWEGQVETSPETLLLLKTAADQLPALEARLHELHSYQIPEFLVLEVSAGSHLYLEWLTSNLRKVQVPPGSAG
jgi:periplasmic divalent cation tolerance protein